MGFVVGWIGGGAIDKFARPGRVRVLAEGGSAEAPGPVSAQRQVSGVAGCLLASMAAS